MQFSKCPREELVAFNGGKHPLNINSAGKILMLKRTEV